MQARPLAITADLAVDSAVVAAAHRLADQEVVAILHRVAVAASTPAPHRHAASLVALAAGDCLGLGSALEDGHLWAAASSSWVRAAAASSPCQEAAASTVVDVNAVPISLPQAVAAVATVMPN